MDTAQEIKFNFFMKCNFKISIFKGMGLKRVYRSTKEPSNLLKVLASFFIFLV